MSPTAPRPGTLYLIPTNLSETFSPAAILPAEVVAIATRLDTYLAENAKSARAFLRGIGLARPLVEVHIAEIGLRSRPADMDELLRPLLEGKDAGLVSEAGAPGVADPGAAVVASAHERGIRVVPLVGPSSLLLALMASGLNGQRFAFHGYLPTQPAERVRAIAELERESRLRGMTQLFIETPYRNGALLADLLKTLSPDTVLCIAADLTGPAERVVRGRVADLRRAPPDPGKIPAMFLFLA